jgi:hypothetical protein
MVIPRKVRLSCPVPSAPGSVSASAGANQATVTWSAANGNGSTITGYVVREATGADAGASVATSGAATAATVTGLAGGTAATFSVVAESSCGTGPAGTSAAVTPAGSTTTYLGSVHASAPSAFYRLAEPVGASVMADSSGNGADGAYSGQQSLGQAQALASDPAPSTGDNSCCSNIGSASPALPQYDSARTIETWINTTSAQTNRAVVGYGQDITDEGFVLSVSPQSVNVDGWNDYLEFPTARPVNDGQWHMITVTYDGTTVVVYLDGQPIGSAPFAGTANTLNTAGLDLAGFVGYNSFTGDMADVAVYPSALSAAIVAAHFAASGYSRPSAAKVVHGSYGGPNAANVTWGHATTGGGVTSYLVSALGGAGSPSVTVPGDATAARLTGLAAGTYTFRVVGMNRYGSGPAATSAKSFTVTGSAATYASTVLSASPSVFYRLADSTPSAADSSGNTATGFYTPNAALGQPGPLPADPVAAISASGNGAAVSGSPSLPLYAQPRTLEGWFNTTSGLSQFLAGYGMQSVSEDFAVAILPNSVYVQGWSDDLGFTSPATLDDGSWHFIVVTTTGSAATVYVDGISLGTQEFPVPLDTVATPPGLLIGGGLQGCCGSFTGDLADIAVFPTALTAAQVTAQFAASGLGRPPAPGSPAATAGANQATVSWSAPTGASPPVTGYLVTAMNGSTAGSTVSVPAAASTATVTGLVGGTAYTFRIQAVNEYGTGTAATTTAVTPTGSASTYASTVLSAKPSVFYRLADAAQAAMADSSGGGATGTYTAAPTLGVAGPLPSDPATAISHNGNGAAASGYPSLPLYAQPRTLEGWVNTTSGGPQFLAGYGRQSSGQDFAVGILPNSVYVQGWSDDREFTSPATLNDGNWHFIVVTTTGSTATVYVDGTSLGTRSFPVSLNTLPSTQGLQIGGGLQGCCGSFTGDLADIAVFPTALNAAQVTAQFAASGLARPLAPGSPAATAGTNQATVSWSAPPGATPPVSGYLITAVEGSTRVNAVSVPATVSTATVTGLAGGTAYTFRIQAVNEYGAGAAATTTAVTPTGSASTYASTVLSAKPSAFYRLADTAQAAMADSSGHTATGTYTGQLTFGQPGPLASDPATAVNSGGFGPTASSHPSLPLYAQPRTLEGWVNTTRGQQFLAGYGALSTNELFAVAIQPNDVIVQGYNDDLTFPTPAPLNDGNWHFIVVTTDGSSATAYVDGASLGSQSFPATLDTLPTPQGLQIGAGGVGGCCDFSGSLADIALFPTALTATQVTAQWAASGNTAAPLSSHPMRPTHQKKPAASATPAGLAHPARHRPGPRLGGRS